MLLECDTTRPVGPGVHRGSTWWTLSLHDVEGYECFWGLLGFFFFAFFFSLINLSNYKPSASPAPFPLPSTGMSPVDMLGPPGAAVEF